MGQLELAQRVGVSRRTIARLENGEVADPGIDQVRGLAAALGVTVGMLTERRLVQVTIPVPDNVRVKLAGDNGPALLEKAVAAIERA